MGFERIFICNSQAFVALLVVGGHLHIEWHVEELERPCCQKSIFFSGSQILERSSRLPWKSKIFAWFKSPPPDGFIFDPLAIANMKGPQLLTEPNPKIDVPLLFVHWLNHFPCDPIFCEAPKISLAGFPARLFDAFGRWAFRGHRRNQKLYLGGAFQGRVRSEFHVGKPRFPAFGLFVNIVLQWSLY